jgi:ABC-type multidrug transport system fused ATPase/permease subunit
MFGFGFSAYMLFATIKRMIDRKALGRKRFEEEANRDATVAIHGIKDIKTFLKESFFLGKYAHSVNQLAKNFGAMQFYQKLPTTALETLGIVFVVVVACGMLYLMNASVERVTGMLAMLVACAWRALPALNRILSGAAQLKSSVPYIHNFVAYLDEEHLLDRGESLEEIPEDAFEFQHAVEWAGVSFRYLKAPTNALTGINMSVRKGEALGIVGPSGAGKSTLVDVLIGLNAASEGRILVDGRILEAKHQRRWRRMVGYVPQSPYIYDGTLAENIAFGVGAGSVDRARVEECCRMAAIDFLENLEKGIDTRIGERGAKLSGGQRQRIAIARALYHKPRILIFDEATSALDSKNERAIQDTIYALKGTLTIILIAHRLSTVTECDRVICLEEGRIAMEGDTERVLAWYEENLSSDRKKASAGQPE